MWLLGFLLSIDFTLRESNLGQVLSMLVPCVFVQNGFFIQRNKIHKERTFNKSISRTFESSSQLIIKSELNCTRNSNIT